MHLTTFSKSTSTGFNQEKVEVAHSTEEDTELPREGSGGEGWSLAD